MINFIIRLKKEPGSSQEIEDINNKQRKASIAMEKLEVATPCEFPEVKKEVALAIKTFSESLSA